MYLRPSNSAIVPLQIEYSIGSLGWIANFLQTRIKTNIQFICCRSLPLIVFTIYVATVTKISTPYVNWFPIASMCQTCSLLFIIGYEKHKKGIQTATNERKPVTIVQDSLQAYANFAMESIKQAILWIKLMSILHIIKTDVWENLLLLLLLSVWLNTKYLGLFFEWDQLAFNIIIPSELDWISY